MIAIQEMIYISNGGYSENDYSESDILNFKSILSVLYTVPPERILIRNFSSTFGDKTISFATDSYSASIKWPGIDKLDQKVTINLNDYSITTSDGTVLHEGDPGYYELIDAISEAASLAPKYAGGEMPGYEERGTEEILFLSKIRDKIAKSHAFVPSLLDIENLGNGLYHIQADGRGLQLDVYFNINTFAILDSAQQPITNNAEYFSTYFNIVSALEELINKASGVYDPEEANEGDKHYYQQLLAQWKQIPAEDILIQDYSASFGANNLSFDSGTSEAVYTWPLNPLIASPTSIDLNTYAITTPSGTVLTEGDEGYYNYIDAIIEATQNAIAFASGEEGYTALTTKDIIMLIKIRDRLAESHAFTTPYLNINDQGNGLYQLQADGRSLQLDVYFNVNSFELFDSSQQSITDDSEFFSIYFDIISALEELIKKAEGFYDPADTDEALKQEYQNILNQWKQIPAQNILIQDYSASFDDNKLFFNSSTYKAEYTWPLNPIIASPTSINLNTFAITIPSGTVLREGDEDYYNYIDAMMEASQNAISFATGEQGFTPLTTQDIIMLSKIRDKLAAAHAFTSSYLNMNNLGNDNYHIEADGRTLQLDVYFNTDSYEISDANQQPITDDASYHTAYFDIVSALEELIQKFSGFYDPADLDETKKQEYQDILTKWKEIPPDDILIQDFETSFFDHSVDLDASTYTATFIWPSNPLIASATTINLEDYSITLSTGEVITPADSAYLDYFNAISAAARDSVLFAAGEQGHAEKSTEEIIMLSKIRDKIGQAPDAMFAQMTPSTQGTGPDDSLALAEMLNIQSIESSLRTKVAVPVKVSADAADTYAWAGVNPPVLSALQYYGAPFIQSQMNGVNPSTVELVTDEEDGTNADPSAVRVKLSDIITVASAHDAKLENAVNNLKDQLQVAVFYANPENIENSAIETAKKWVDDNQELLTAYPGKMSSLFSQQGLFFASFVGLNMPLPLQVSILNNISATLLSLFSAMMSHKRLTVRNPKNKNKIIAVNPALIAQRTSDFRFQSNLNTTTSEMILDLINKDYSMFVPVMSENDKLVMQDVFSNAAISPENISIQIVRPGESTMDTIQRTFPASLPDDIVLLEKQSNLDNGQLMNSAFDRETAKNLKIVGVREDTLLEDALGIAGYLANIINEDYQDPQLTAVQEMMTEYLAGTTDRDITPETIDQLIESLKTNGYFPTFQSPEKVLNYMNMIRGLNFISASLSGKFMQSPFNSYVWLENGDRVNLKMPVGSQVERFLPGNAQVTPKKQDRLQHNQELLDSMI